MRALVVCYRIAAGEGSESGSGYHFISEIRRHVDSLVVVTRVDNAAALAGDPSLAGVRFVGIDVPRRLTRWKRGPRGVIPYYYLWQLCVGRLVRRLHRDSPFDVVHQYNFHTDWAPHFLTAPGARVIWGPICHQPRLPRSYCHLEPVGGPLREAFKAAAKASFWHFDPSLRRAIRRTDVILYANRDVAPPFRAAPGVQLQTFGGADFLTHGDATLGGNGPLRLVHVGRAVSIKGAAVALEALASCTNGAAGGAVLLVIGAGPLHDRLRLFAGRLGIADRVVFLPWMSQAALAEHYRAADALLYPSLSNQDTVVAEGLAAGLTVIGVARTGAEIMAGHAGIMAPREPHADTVAGLARAIVTLAEEKVGGGDRLLARRRAALARSRELSWPATAAGIADRYTA